MRISYALIAICALCSNYIHGASQGGINIGQLKDAIENGRWEDREQSYLFGFLDQTAQGVKSIINNSDTSNPVIDEKSGMTALHYAAAKGQHDIVSKLIGTDNPHGPANPNVQDNNGDTPLHYNLQGIGVEKKNISENVVEALLANNASILTKNKEGESPVEAVFGISIRKTRTQLLNLFQQHRSKEYAQYIQNQMKDVYISLSALAKAIPKNA